MANKPKHEDDMLPSDHCAAGNGDGHTVSQEISTKTPEKPEVEDRRSPIPDDSGETK